MIPIYDYKTQKQAVEERLFSRSQLTDPQVVQTVEAVLADVRERGDAALLEYTEKFDGVCLTPETMRVSPEEIRAAYERMDDELLAVYRRAIANIRAYHEKQKRNSWVDFEEGKALGQLIIPMESAGVYAPGGKAAYPSSVLMDIVPAKVAGVKRVVMVTPPDKDGSAFYQTIVAAAEAGADDIYKVGGAQAVGALAYGTKSIAPVDTIVGPGNIYVANAKRSVYGHVGIDMIAGPSEVLVVADEEANPAYLAADLLSQAEHDELAAAILVTDSRALALKVQTALNEQLTALERATVAEASIKNYGVIVVVETMAQAMALANRVAPEHLELAVKDPFAMLSSVKNAGAVFLGAFAPEPLGDYYAGTNHVLPTSGTARFASALSVDDFIKKTSVVYYGEEQLRASWHDVAAFAESEGLTAHAKSVRIRFEGEEEDA